MIRFEQVGDGTPKDVKVTTDDGEAELAVMNDALVEAGENDPPSVLQKALDDARQENGEWTFTIPGSEVGDAADLFYEVGLDDWVEEQNERTLKEAEARTLKEAEAE